MYWSRIEPKLYGSSMEYQLKQCWWWPCFGGPVWNLNWTDGECEWCTECRADFRFVSSQWEMSSQSNAISHWLGANLESALRMYMVMYKSDVHDYHWQSNSFHIGIMHSYHCIPASINDYVPSFLYVTVRKSFIMQNCSYNMEHG